MNPANTRLRLRTLYEGPRTDLGASAASGGPPERNPQIMRALLAAMNASVKADRVIPHTPGMTIGDVAGIQHSKQPSREADAAHEKAEHAANELHKEFERLLAQHEPDSAKRDTFIERFAMKAMRDYERRGFGSKRGAYALGPSGLHFDPKGELAEDLKPKLETLDERMGLIDWKPYGKLVADAYEARPKNDPAAHASFKALREHILKMFTRMTPAVKIVFTDENPYTSEDELFTDIKKNRTLKVWTGESKHGFWGEQDNWRFRAVHDFISHHAGGHRFDLKGEIAAFNRHAKTAPPAALPALFSEVVGQASFAIDRGHFGEQKVCVLHGFDYVRLGAVDPEGYKKNFSDGKIPAPDAELLQKLELKPAERGRPVAGVAESLSELALILDETKGKDSPISQNAAALLRDIVAGKRIAWVEKGTATPEQSRWWMELVNRRLVELKKVGQVHRAAASPRGEKWPSDRVIPRGFQDPPLKYKHEAIERRNALVLELAETSNLPTDVWGRVSEAWLAIMAEGDVDDLEKKLAEPAPVDPSGRPRGRDENPGITKDKLIKAHLDAGESPDSPKVAALLKEFEKHTLEHVRGSFHTPEALTGWLSAHGFYGGPIFVGGNARAKDAERNRARHHAQKNPGAPLAPTPASEFAGEGGLEKAKARMAQTEKDWTDLGGHDINSSSIKDSVHLFRTPDGYAIRVFTFDTGKHGKEGAQPEAKTFFYFLRKGFDVYGRRFVTPKERKSGVGEIGGKKKQGVLKKYLNPDERK